MAINLLTGKQTSRNFAMGSALAYNFPTKAERKTWAKHIAKAENRPAPAEVVSPAPHTGMSSLTVALAAVAGTAVVITLLKK